MNKKSTKGFTLMEILAVIAIIGIIMLIAIPSILSVSKSIRRRELETKKEALIASAEKYAKENLSEFKGATIMQVPVRTLLYYGYINSDKKCDEVIGCVINPVNNSSMNNEIITVKRNLSITQATWGEENEYIYATFNANGNGCSVGETGLNQYELKLGCNGPCEIEAPRINRTNFSILGWNKNKNAREIDYKVGDKILLNSSVTFYAITKKEINITFDANGGEITGTNSRNCAYYNTETSCSVNDVNVHKSGFTHTGWFESASGGQKISLQAVSNSMTVYAGWKPNILTIEYNGNGGTWNTPTNNRFTESNGKIIEVSTGNEYRQIIEYGQTLPNSGDMGLYNYNGAYMNWTRSGYSVSSGKEYFIDGTTITLNQEQQYTAIELANSADCDLSEENCDIIVNVNWSSSGNSTICGGYYVTFSNINLQCDIYGPKKTQSVCLCDGASTGCISEASIRIPIMGSGGRCLLGATFICSSHSGQNIKEHNSNCGVKIVKNGQEEIIQ